MKYNELYCFDNNVIASKADEAIEENYFLYNKVEKYEIYKLRKDTNLWVAGKFYFYKDKKRFGIIATNQLDFNYNLDEFIKEVTNGPSGIR